MECIIAKIFGSEAQKEATIEIAMKTHGGRSFLHGHMIGDNLHDLLAPCIYEGEGEILSLALFKTLIKNHGKTYFEPIGKALDKEKVKSPRMKDLWKYRREFGKYAWWLAKEYTTSKKYDIRSIHPGLQKNYACAINALQGSSLKIDKMMRRHQLKLADRQIDMFNMSNIIQNAVTVIVTTQAANNTNNLRMITAKFLGDRLLFGKQDNQQIREISQKLYIEKFHFSQSHDILMQYK